MEKNNLKLMWQEINTGKGFDKKQDIEETIRMRHCNRIAKILYTQKLKCCVYAGALLIFAGLMIYAFGYLGLHLSFSSIIPLALTGLFLFIKTVFECSRLWVLMNESDNRPLKESALLFRQKLEQIKRIDFLSALVYCYGWATAIIWVLIRDHEALKEFLVLILIIILSLLSVPWLIIHQHYRRYKDIYNDLNQSTDFFNNHF